MKVLLMNIATANLDDVYLQIESKSWNVKDLMPKFNNQCLVAAAADNNTWNWYIDFDADIQSFGSAAGAGAAGNFRVIERSPACYKNFMADTIGQFTGGRQYLVNYSAYAVVKMIPSFVGIPAVKSDGTNALVYSSTRYHYTAPNTESPIYETEVDVITFDVDLAVYNQLQSQRMARKQAEINNYLLNQ